MDPGSGKTASLVLEAVRASLRAHDEAHERLHTLPIFLRERSVSMRLPAVEWLSNTLEANSTAAELDWAPRSRTAWEWDRKVEAAVADAERRLRIRRSFSDAPFHLRHTDPVDRPAVLSAFDPLFFAQTRIALSATSRFVADGQHRGRAWEVFEFFYRWSRNSVALDADGDAIILLRHRDRWLEPALSGLGVRILVVYTLADLASEDAGGVHPQSVGRERSRARARAREPHARSPRRDVAQSQFQQREAGTDGPAARRARGVRCTTPCGRLGGRSCSGDRARIRGVPPALQRHPRRVAQVVRRAPTRVSAA